MLVQFQFPMTIIIKYFIEQEYKSMWKISGNASWESIITKADVLEKSDQVMECILIVD